ncbi:hypothetical protein BaRGS_00026015 [Batillaria attramentaria]|uniref:Uncharacterized protein n=1 Tax=Batillaria attramentaria TaxID=370345 RepID=A0ABD0K791_9CAEN
MITTQAEWLHSNTMHCLNHKQGNRNRRKTKIILLIVLFVLATLLAWQRYAEVDTNTAKTEEAAVTELRFIRNHTCTPKGQVGTKTGPGGAEKHHVFFLKVHKAASTTVQNVLLRFSLSRQLKVMLPRSGHILSQRKKHWLARALSLPPNVPAFDILCNHIVFDEEAVRARLYPDSIFIGIVREPVDQFVSAFNYYRNRYGTKYLKKVPDISTYLSNPERWEPRDLEGSYTNNRMSFDFGIDPVRIRNQSYVADYIEYLNKTFHLVLISGRFDESMILMRRYLGWKMKDVLYIKNNAYKNKKSAFTEKQKIAHRRFNMADYALYEHFSNLFDKRVAAEGKEFREEMQVYTSVRNSVEMFCGDNSTGNDYLNVDATLWSEGFYVSKANCILMTMTEESLVNAVRLQLL